MQEAFEKKISAKEALILYIKAKRPLWDLSEKDYKNLPLKTKLYSDVYSLMKEEFDPETLSDLGLNSPEGVKIMWKHLRSTYNMNKKKRKGKSGSGSADIQKPWIWQELMSFVDVGGPNLDSLRTSSLHLAPSSEVIFLYLNFYQME